MKIFKCIATLDDGCKIEDKELLISAVNSGTAWKICHDMLCKHNEDFMPTFKCEVIELPESFGIILEKGTEIYEFKGE